MNAQAETIALVKRHNSAPSRTQYTTTGVILFNSTGQLLFMNQEAQFFIRQLQPYSASTRENGTCLIPNDIHSVVRDLINLLMHCEHPKD
ncbi:hypothetical protein, partial [Petrachloros mirabilis]